MPRANRKTTFTNLRPIEGTPYELDPFDRLPSTCSHCGDLATHVVDKPIASPYSAAPDQRRTYRLCTRHAYAVQPKVEPSERLDAAALLLSGCDGRRHG